MNKRYFSHLTDYNAWASAMVRGWLDQINDSQWELNLVSSFSSIKQTTIHIVSAEKIWIDFWNSVPDPVFLSRSFKGSKSDLIEIWKKSSAELKDTIENYPEERYEQAITFGWRNQEWQMEFWQTFSHFINHATYHRGQLVTLLRQAGFANLSSTDLATYSRLVKD